MRMLALTEDRFSTLIAIALCLGLVCGCSPKGEELRARAAQSLEEGNARAAMVDLKNYLEKSPNDGAARLMLGQAFLALGDTQAAANELTRARDLGVDTVPLRMALASAWLLLGDYEQAAAEADPGAASSDDDRRNLLIVRGQALVNAQHNAEAATAFEKALEIAPNDVTALLGLATCTQRLQGLEPAREIIERARRVAPENPRVDLTLGQLLLADGKPADAERAFQRLVDALQNVKGASPELLAARAHLAEAQVAQGKAREAVATTDVLMGAAPEVRAIVLLRVRALLLVKDYGPARELLEGLVVREPQDHTARLLLGAVNYAQGNLEQADMHLASVLAVQPENAMARKLLADTRLQLERPGAALEALHVPLSERNADVRELAMAARALQQQGNQAAGMSYLESAHTANPMDVRVSLDLARAYLVDGTNDKAIKLLETVTPSEASEPRRTLLLALAYGGKGDSATAQRLLERVLADEADTDTLVMVAQVHTLLGNTDAAIDEFERALRAAPTHTDARVGLARARLAAGNTTAAEQHLRQVLREQPRELPALLAMAEVAVARRDPGTAVKWLQQARDAAPSAVSPRLLLAQYYLAAGDPGSSRQAATDLIKLAPEYAEAYNVLGLALLALRENRQAALQFETAARLSDLSLYQVNLARAQLADGNVAAARIAIDRAVAQTPASVPVLTLRAQILAREGKHERALAEAEALQRSYPSLANGFIVAADIHLKRHDYEEADAAFAAASQRLATPALAVGQYRARHLGKLDQPLKPLETWVQSQPNDSRMWLVLAQARQEQGAPQAAIDAYSRVLELAPQDVVALNNLAWLYHLAGDSRALGLAERAYGVKPDNAATADTYGWLLTQSGDVEKALPILRQAAGARDAPPVVRYHLAAALVRAGRTSEARTVLAQLLSSGARFEGEDKARELMRDLGDEDHG